jgi:uncharacterized membrane protein
MKTILIALLAAIGFGLTGPVTKIAFNSKVSLSNLTLVTGLCLILVSIVFSKGIKPELFQMDTKALFFCVLASVMFALSFWAANTALSSPLVAAAIVLTILGINPAIGSLTSLTVFSEWNKVNLIPFLIGLSCIVGGGIVLVRYGMK